MDALQGNIITSLPYKELKKVYDLIYFDGPLLSHFKDAKDQNILYLWVDNNDELNRWLIFKVSDFSLYKYLKNIDSLRNLVLDQSEEFIFTADVDQDLEYSNINLFSKDEYNLLGDYIPEDGVMFSADIPGIYSSFADSFDEDLYLAELKQRAVYFKIKAAKLPSLSLRFGSIVPVKVVNEILDAITKSYKSFSHYSFLEDLKDSFHTPDKLQRAAKSVVNGIEPLFVDVKQSSFSFGISNDIWSIKTEIQAVKPWSKEILKRYKDEVIEVDYHSEEEISSILKKYDLKERQRIFKPLFDVISITGYTVHTSDPTYKALKDLKPPSLRTSNRIIKPKQEDLPALEGQKKKLINIVVEIPKSGEVKDLGKKKINEGLLFSRDVTKLTPSVDQLMTSERVYIFNKPLEYELEFDDNTYYIDYKPLGFSIQVENKDQINNSLAKLLDDLYRDLDNKKELSEEENSNKSHLNEIIQEVIPIES